ncbi:hypothetical protein [Streptomyces lavendulocolor]|uniref:hypothetical protein n=1 Tax=Streptomyces lavendulocolor TaxID=67316 RepID=UPI003C303A97
MIVEPPDRRGLRRVTIHDQTVGSAWSLRELRRVLRDLGYPDDMDLDDGSHVHWRGGDSSVWPDGRGWKRRTVIAVFVGGLLGSLALHAAIGWADTSGALTFPQRLVGILFLMAGAVQAIVVPAVVDYWGRRRVKLSGALILLGVLITLATTSLLLFLWLQEREFIPRLIAFISLWLWSMWALYMLIHDRVWRGIPYPKRFAAGVTATALLTSVSLGYSILYKPITAPVHFALKAEFGTPSTDADSPYIHVPLKFSAKNVGGIPVYLVVDEYVVSGYWAEFSDSGQGMKEWKTGNLPTEAEQFARNVDYETIASGQFQGPGSTLDVGEEFKLEKVITLPKDTDYETLDATLGIAFLRQDRGKIDEEFSYPRPSWDKSAGKYYCPPDECGEELVYHGRIRHNTSLINMTRKPRYVAAFWSPERTADFFISSFDFKRRGIYESLDTEEVNREAERYYLGWVEVNSQVSVKGLLKQAQP